MAMEQLGNWEAAVLAAGVTTVYNADDWERADAQVADGNMNSAAEGPAGQH